MHPLYNKAIEADEAFDKALTEQFGTKGNRWVHNYWEYNEQTKAAYEAKITADETWLNHMRGGEKQ